MDKKDRMFFKEIFARFAKKLDESFASIHIKLNTIMTRQSDFDASLAKLKPAIDQVKSDFEAYKAAAQAQGVDLTNEETALDTSLGALADLHTEVSGTGSTNDPASTNGETIDSSSSAPAPSGSPDPQSTPATTGS